MGMSYRQILSGHKSHIPNPEQMTKMERFHPISHMALRHNSWSGFRLVVITPIKCEDPIESSHIINPSYMKKDVA